MIQEAEVSSKGYVITILNKESGGVATITLAAERDKWVVRSQGFNGYYGSLDRALTETCALLKVNLRRE